MKKIRLVQYPVANTQYFPVLEFDDTLFEADGTPQPSVIKELTTEAIQSASLGLDYEFDSVRVIIDDVYSGNLVIIKGNGEYKPNEPEAPAEPDPVA